MLTGGKITSTAVTGAGAELTSMGLTATGLATKLEIVTISVAATTGLAAVIVSGSRAAGLTTGTAFGSDATELAAGTDSGSDAIELAAGTGSGSDATVWEPIGLRGSSSFWEPTGPFRHQLRLFGHIHSIHRRNSVQPDLANVTALRGRCILRLSDGIFRLELR